jgi:hypothetical protein
MKSNMKSFISKLIIFSILIVPFVSHAEGGFCNDFPELSQKIVASIEGKISHVNDTKEKSTAFFQSKKAEMSGMKYSDEIVKKVISQNVAAPKNLRERISKFTFEKHLNNMAQDRYAEVLSAHKTYFEELESLIAERTEIIETGLEDALRTTKEATAEANDLCSKGESLSAEENFSAAITEVKDTLSETVLNVQDIKSKIMEAKSARDSKIKSAFEKFDSLN